MNFTFNTFAVESLPERATTIFLNHISISVFDSSDNNLINVDGIEQRGKKGTLNTQDRPSRNFITTWHGERWFSISPSRFGTQYTEQSVIFSASCRTHDIAINKRPKNSGFIFSLSLSIFESSDFRILRQKGECACRCIPTYSWWKLGTYHKARSVARGEKLTDKV